MPDKKLKELERNYTKNQINDIFNKIRKDDSFLNKFIIRRTGSSEFFQGNLELYRDALLKEVDCRSASCTHPLRAALALETLNHNKNCAFESNLKNFEKTSQHSGLYPTTKKIAFTLLFCLAIAASVILATLVSIATLPLSFIPLVLLACSSQFIINPNFDCYQFSDIDDVKAKARIVHGFFEQALHNPKNRSSTDENYIESDGKQMTVLKEEDGTEYPETDNSATMRLESLIP